MLDNLNLTDDVSPFHAGEQEIQVRVGKREKMEAFGRRVIRPYMPDQHREFYSKLPFLVVGSVDKNGWPWASVVPGRPGFLSSRDAETLDVNAAAIRGDPLQSAIKPGTPLGLLGIEVPTRRRNRMNGRITEVGEDSFSVTVDQAFGNCPQYIQSRTVEFVREPGANNDAPPPARLSSLDVKATELIAAADTFFVSSYINPGNAAKSEGVDVSHRGGRPGFVKIEGNTLTIPDYSGNSHFNTLGNFLLNPRAGLTFADFATGDLLMLTGTVEILWENDPEVKAFAGAERGWRFILDHAVFLQNALPFTFSLLEHSPSNLRTGDWEQAEATLKAEANRDAWRPYRITRIENESSVIRSFYLEPSDDKAILPFQAGQFLTLRVKGNNSDEPNLRTYTVSSAPGEPHYRISVKREQGGVVSAHMHDELQVGDMIEAKAPRGGFFIDASGTRPAVLLGGGVGITPMISMAQHVVNEGNRTRHFRPLHILHTAKSTNQRAFAEVFQDMERQANGAIKYRTYISRPRDGEQSGIEFDGNGRITADVLRRELQLDDYDYYLCGPGPFMQAVYDALRHLGVRDARIFAEAFGPASLDRRPDKGEPAPTPKEEADNAVIRFAKSGFEQQWSHGGGTILETAEAHGLSPEFGCRNGSCGACAVKLKSGSVTYRTPPSTVVEEDNVLACCAVPAKGSDTVAVDL